MQKNKPFLQKVFSLIGCCMSSKYGIGDIIYRRVRIFGLVCIAGVFALVALYSISWKNTIEESLYKTADFSLRIIDEYFKQAQEQLLSVSDYIAISGQYDDILKIIIGKANYFNALYLLDEQGKMLSKRNFFTINPNFKFSEFPWQKTLENNQTFISSSIKKRNTIPMILSAVAIDKSKRSHKTLLAELDTINLWKEVISIKVGKTGGVFVADSNGMLIFDRNLWNLRHNIRISDYFDLEYNWQKKPKAELKLRKNGGFYFMLPLKSKQSQWIVVAYKPLLETLSLGSFIVLILFFGLIFVVFSIKWIDEFIKKTILAPLDALRRSITLLNQEEIPNLSLKENQNELIYFSNTLNTLSLRIEGLLEDLMMNESKFRSFFEKSSSIMILLNPFNGQILDLNGSALKFYGYSKEEFLRMSIFDITIMPPIEMAYERYRVFSENRTYYATRHKIATGEIREVKLQMTHIENLQYPMYFMVVLDTTKPKGFQELTASTMEFFETGPIIFISWFPTSHWAVAEVSKNVQEILGYSQNEMLSSSFSYRNILHEGDLDRIAREYKKNVQSDTTEFGQKYRLKHKNGQYIWFFDYTKFVRNDKNEVVKIKGYLINQSEAKELEYEARDEKEKIESIVWATGVGTWRWNSRDDEFLFDERWAEIMGYSLEELKDFSFEDWKALFYEADLEVSESLLDECFIGNRTSYILEARLKHKKGHFIWVLIKAKVTADRENLSDISMMGTMLEISSRKEAELQLKLAASVFSHSREGITITDNKGAIIEVNEAFTRITGYTREEALGQNPRILKSGRHDDEYYAKMWADLNEKGYWRGEIWNQKKDGEIFPEILTINVVYDSHGAPLHYLAIFQDIKELKAQQAQFEYIAHHDSLTNLPNRALFSIKLQEAMKNALLQKRSLTVAYLDLDGFKEVNDTYGHEMGDKVLISTSSRIKHILRDGDLIARLGGDEFAILMMDLEDEKDSHAMFSRILIATTESNLIDDKVISISASIGATFFPQNEDVDADQLLRQADSAMYQAKLAGKNRYVLFDLDKDKILREYHKGLSNIQEALENEEFKLEYQPKVNMKTGEILGFEALLRWEHKTRGLLRADEFLVGIQNESIMQELSLWVIKNALLTQESWRSYGVFLPISINLNSIKFQGADSANYINEILEQLKDIEKSSLILEISDMNILENIEYYEQTLQTFKAVGIEFALDDFGTNHASLMALKTLPITELKIDKEYIVNMLDDPYDFAIAESMLAMANAFRKTVIAKGVESQLQGEILLKIGYQIAQGYEIARPMSGKEVVKWIKLYKPNSTWKKTKKTNSKIIALYKIGVEHRSQMQEIEKYIDLNECDKLNQKQYYNKLMQWKQSIEYINCKDLKLLEAHQKIYELMNEAINECNRNNIKEAKKLVQKAHSCKDSLLCINENQI